MMEIMINPITPPPPSYSSLSVVVVVVVDKPEGGSQGIKKMAISDTQTRMNNYYEFNDNDNDNDDGHQIN